MRKRKSTQSKLKEKKKLTPLTNSLVSFEKEIVLSVDDYEKALNDLKEKSYQDLSTLRELILEYENQVILLKEQNRFLITEKQSLSETIKEYENLYKEWSIEKRKLVDITQKSLQQAENCKQTKSFRLGYALIFGFKSWQGFKNMCITLYSLLKEYNKNKKMPIISSINNTLKQPENKSITWISQKPILQWTLPCDVSYLSAFTSTYLNNNLKDQVIRLENAIETFVDCSQVNQLVIKTNIFSKDYPLEQKQCLLTIKFYNENGNEIKSLLSIPFSQRLKKYYFYLNSESGLNDYIFLLLPKETTKVGLGLALWDNKSDIYHNNKLDIVGFSDGISVILPTFQGEKTIIKCLQSLLNQTFPYSKYEILIVINGEQDNTISLIENFKEKNPKIQIRIFELEEGNVSKARNYALQHASKAWVTFIDDDDFVSVNYLSTLYQHSLCNTIAITGIEDILDGKVIRSNIMNQLDKAANKADLDYFDVTSSLTMNACKLIPTFMAKSINYNSSLRSGEDVVYWCQLLNKFRPKVVLVPNYQEDNYKRLIRKNSISRKAESYDFNVFQRLEVIKLLIDELSTSQYSYIENFIQSKIDAQANFIRNYLQRYPGEYLKYLNDVHNLNIHNSFVGKINSLFADTLVISYCFAPYIDTSGIVMSKRIREMGKPVDLISNSMSRVREIDEELLKIAEYYLGAHYELNAPQSFANWKAIAQFADGVLDTTHNLLKQRETYKQLYSRAMWPASHIAASLVKIKYPNMKWIAEFSDPILMDVSAKERYEELPVEWLEKHGFIPRNHGICDKQNLFYWCEKLPYLYADELIFTNQNQLEYMLSYADTDLHEMILKKARVVPQPTLDREFYQLSQIKLIKEAGKFHLAYFGSFYANRGFAPFVKAWQQLPDNVKNNLKLYIYTQQDVESILSDIPTELLGNIIIQTYVGYFDFLALSDQFDALIVMDAETKGLKLANPYLPSKLSDYLGSKTIIFALFEEGSPMSNIEADKLIKVNMSSVSSIQNKLLSLLEFH